MAQSCKKIVATGARTTVIMQEERCFGYLNAEVATPTNYLGNPKRLEITSESIINEIGSFQSAALTPDRAVIRRQQGSAAVGGDLNVELSGNGQAWLIVQAIGKIVGSGLSSDPYTIVPVDGSGVASDKTAGYQQNPALYDSAAEIHYDSANSGDPGYETGYYTVDPNAMEPGFSLLVSRDGGTIGGLDGNQPTNEIWFKYTGMKVNSWSITAGQEIVTSVFSLLGRKEEVVDIPAPSYTSKPAVNDPFAGFNGEVLVDGESECILSLDMTVNNNLNGDQYCMGDRYRNSVPEGRREIEGTITMELRNLKFYNKYLTGAAVSLVVNFDLLGDGTETMKIILPQIEFTGTTPTVGGPEVIPQELPFMAIFDPSPAENTLVKGVSNVAPNGFDIAIEIVTAGTLV